MVDKRRELWKAGRFYVGLFGEGLRELFGCWWMGEWENGGGEGDDSGVDSV